MLISICPLLKVMVTGTLNIRAVKLARSQLIRDASRASIEGALKNWIPWLPAECRNKVFIIKFGDEAADKAVAKHFSPAPDEHRR